MIKMAKDMKTRIKKQMGELCSPDHHIIISYDDGHTIGVYYEDGEDEPARKQSCRSGVPI